MADIRLTNTMSGEKEVLTILPNDPVRMYVCGVTPYDYAHLGHGRCYVVFDVLCRVLMANGYQVAYCRNFTDIDDKLIARAERELGDRYQFNKVADRFIQAFEEDVEQLNCLVPSYQPRVTQVIPDIIDFVEKLIAAGKAYAANGSVYFSVDQDACYGCLAKRNIDEMRAGARVDINDEKRNPMDFALWKAEPAGGFWDSPWGNGRPGWHIECSVMAHKYLGEHIDIHGGGMDLIFPHHENERAQSEGLFGTPYVRHWVHNAFVRIDKEKMSKSLGNFFTLRQVFEQFDPMVVRFMLLGLHYRSPLDFSLSDMAGHEKGYRRLVRSFEAIQPVEPGAQPAEHAARMLSFLADDLNTPGALGVAFESIGLNLSAHEMGQIFWVLKQVMGLRLEPLLEDPVELSPEVEQLVAARDEARARKDWTTADALREQLRALGYEVQDKK